MTVARRLLGSLLELLFALLVAIGGDRLRSTGTLLRRVIGWGLEIGGLAYAVVAFVTIWICVRLGLRGAWGWDIE